MCRLRTSRVRMKWASRPWAAPTPLTSTPCSRSTRTQAPHGRCSAKPTLWPHQLQLLQGWYAQTPERMCCRKTPTWLRDSSRHCLGCSMKSTVHQWVHRVFSNAAWLSVSLICHSWGVQCKEQCSLFLSLFYLKVSEFVGSTWRMWICYLMCNFQIYIGDWYLTQFCSNECLKSWLK